MYTRTNSPYSCKSKFVLFLVPIVCMYYIYCKTVLASLINNINNRKIIVITKITSINITLW